MAAQYKDFQFEMTQIVDQMVLIICQQQKKRHKLLIASMILMHRQNKLHQIVSVYTKVQFFCSLYFVIVIILHI